MGLRDFFQSGRNADPDPEEAPEPGVELEVWAPENGGSEDKYSKFRGTPLMQAILPSGIWVVIKFSDALEAGQFEEDFRSAQIIKARSGEAAIKAAYTADVKAHGSYADLVKAKGEDGRYVALDFYTGHRIEALVRGGWHAELEVA